MLDRLVRPTTFMVVILLQSSTPAFCQVAATSFSPFVIGTIPVVGRGGAVGGVRVDPQGVLTRAELADGVELHLIQTSKEGIETKKDFHLAVAVNSLPDFIKMLEEKKVPFESWQGDSDVQLVRHDAWKDGGCGTRVC